MGAKTSCCIEPEEMRSLTDETGFSGRKLNELFFRFQSLDNGSKGYLNREDIMKIEGLSINPLADRISDSFFDGKETLDFRSFVTSLATFQPRKGKSEGLMNSRERKLKFLFSMYDAGGRGVVSKNNVVQIIRMMVGVDTDQEMVKNMAERIILDSCPQTREITFDDFKQIMSDVVIETQMSVKFHT